MEFFRVVYNWVFILQLLFVSISLVVVFYPFGKTLKSFAFAAVHLIALFAAGTLLHFGGFALSTVWHGFGGINFPIAWFAMVFGYCAIVRINAVSKIIMGATQYTAVIAIGELGRDLPLLAAPGVDLSFVTILCYLFIVAYSFLLRKFSLKDYSEIYAISAILMLIIALSLITLVFFKSTVLFAGEIVADVYYILSCGVIYIVSLSSYLLMYFICKNRNEITELQIMNRLLKADNQMLAISEQAIVEMKAMRHDIKNQLDVMGIMLHQKRYDELSKYFASVKLSATHEGNNAFVDCGNVFVNSIINMEVLKANNYGIQLITQINIPANLPFNQSDLCRLIVNLLDNAMEAVLRAGNKSFLVDLKILKCNNYLYVCVSNELRDGTDKKKLLLKTEKSDSVNHGFGHRIIKRIAEKYNGNVHYTIENNEFVAEVMLSFSAAVEVENG